MLKPHQTIAYLDSMADRHAKFGDAQGSAIYDVGARLAELLIVLSGHPVEAPAPKSTEDSEEPVS